MKKTKSAAISSDVLDEFVGRLIEEKKLDDLEPDIREQMKKDLKDRAEDRINAVILEKLPPEKLEEFERLMEGAADSTGSPPNEEKIQEFCRKHIPDLDEALAAELLRFRQVYLYG